MDEQLITVCIPTCFGGEALIDAVRSIRMSAGSRVPIVVAADSIPLSPSVKNKLTNLDVDFIENRKSGSQISKINQLLNLVKTPYVIFTQDDISISKNTFDSIKKMLASNSNITMFSVRNLPTPPTTFVDFGLVAGTVVTGVIEEEWLHGDNYLRGCGRFLGFKTSHMKKFRLPDGIVNVDAYLYFENKLHKGVFDRIEDSYMYYTLPKTLEEQIRKSSRYQYCKEEMQKYFRMSSLNFDVPLHLKLRGLVRAFFTSPLQLTCYFPILILTRVIKEKKMETKSALWKIDKSTK